MKNAPTQISKKKSSLHKWFLIGGLIMGLALHFKSHSLVSYIIWILITVVTFYYLGRIFTSCGKWIRIKYFFITFFLIIIQLFLLTSLNYTRPVFYVKNIFTNKCEKVSSQDFYWYKLEDPLCGCEFHKEAVYNIFSKCWCKTPNEGEIQRYSGEETIKFCSEL